MKKHVDGVEPCHGNWFMKSPGKRNIAAAQAKRKQRKAEGTDELEGSYGSDDSDGSDSDDMSSFPIGGAARQSPRAKAQCAKAKAEKRAKKQAKEDAKAKAQKAAEDAGRSARAGKCGIDAEA